MKLLLDTHVALWWVVDDPRLSRTAVRVVESVDAEVFLSAVVVWEVAIKRALGKLEAGTGLVEILTGGGARPLPVSLDHAAAVERLPPNHGDPFDRLLVAQAQIEGAVVVTADHAIGAYDVPVLW